MSSMHDEAAGERRSAPRTTAPTGRPETGLAALQHTAGNQAVTALIQAKLQVGAADDPLEREADRVAKRVVAGAHRHDGPDCADCVGTVEAAVQRRPVHAAGAQGGEVDGATDASIRQAAGGGRPLDADVQRTMEAGFGVDFSAVRVHDDAGADQLNRSLGARAFTTGPDIFFRQGEFSPQTPSGEELLAHELTHVVQQGAAGAGAEVVHRSADDAIQRQKWPIGSTGEELEVSWFTWKSDRMALVAEAEKIITDLKTTYDVTVSSSTTIAGIRDNYTSVKNKVLGSLRSRAWKIGELRALQRALGYYASILGAERAKSTRAGDAQEVTSVGKVKQAIDENTPAGKLDTTTLGEYFASKRNMGLFKASERFTGDFSKLEDQLTGTFVHEIAHGLIEYAIPDFIKATGYWKDTNNELPKPQRTESPITDYGGTNAAEDICESAMMYFVEPKRLQKACPKRYAFMVKLGKDWLPPVAEAPQIQPDAKGETPKAQAPKDAPVPPQLEQAEDEIDKLLAQIDPPVDEPATGTLTEEELASL